MPDSRSFPISRYIAQAHDFFGVTPAAVAGALYGQRGSLTVDQASALIAAFLGHTPTPPSPTPGVPPVPYFLLRPRGSYSSGTDYLPADAVVGSDGGTYVAMTETVGVDPVGDGSGTWMLLVSGGGGGGGAVASVFGRTGAVTAHSGDYSPGQVGADASGAAAVAQAASLQKSANLADVGSAASARGSLGLGSAATHPAGDFDTAGAAATEQTRAQAAEALLIPLSQKGAANGVATLASDGTLPTGQLPALAITDVHPVVSQAAMLSIPGAHEGTVAVRSDTGETWLCGPGDPTLLATWIRLPAVGDVTSVNGQQGVVVLAAADVGADAAGAAASAQSAAQASSLQKAANLGDVASASSARGNLGLGSAATHPSTDFDAAGAAAAAEAASDPSGSAASAQAASLQKTQNLADVASAATARTNLGLGSAATHPSTDFDAAGAAAAAQAASDPSGSATTAQGRAMAISLAIGG